jgi:hypothetical protein
VLQDLSYRERADYFQKVISTTRGLDVAANIIEQAFHKYQTDILANQDSQLSLHRCILWLLHRRTAGQPIAKDNIDQLCTSVHPRR